MVETALPPAERGIVLRGETGSAAPPAADRAAPAGRRTVQSVERALDILEALARAGGEMKLGEMVARTGLNPSTCHHLIGTLVGRDYVGQNPRGRAYYLANKVLELSGSRLRQLDLLDIATPELRRLNRATEETVHLAAMQGHDLVTLARLDSPKAPRVGSDAIGKTSAAHATATGKAILAWLPETQIARVIAEKGLQRFTPATLTSIGELVEELRYVRRNGYALDREEFQPGVVCVGSAIRDHAGAVIGSVGCSLPASRADDDHIARLTDEVRRTARTLSERYGSPAESATTGAGEDSRQEPGP